VREAETYRTVFWVLPKGTAEVLVPGEQEAAVVVDGLRPKRLHVVDASGLVQLGLLGLQLVVTLGALLAALLAGDLHHVLVVNAVHGFRPVELEAQLVPRDDAVWPDKELDVLQEVCHDGAHRFLSLEEGEILSLGEGESRKTKSKATKRSQSPNGSLLEISWKCCAEKAEGTFTQQASPGTFLVFFTSSTE